MRFIVECLVVHEHEVLNMIEELPTASVVKLTIIMKRNAIEIVESAAAQNKIKLTMAITVSTHWENVREYDD